MHLRRTAVVRLSVAAAAVLALLAPVQAQNAAPKKHFLWKVEGGKTPLYLLGSIHLLSSAYYPLPAAIDEAFESAGTLVEEVNLDEALSPASMALILSKAMLQDGKTLDQVLSKDSYARLAAYMKSAGMPLDRMRRFKPWMVSLTITTLEAQKAGFDPNFGVDKHFFDRAKKAGKTVKGLETAAYQIDRLDAMAEADQDDLVRKTLAEVETERANIKTMADAWASGDAPTLETLLLDSFKESPAVYERLLVERNRNWMPELETCLDAPRPCFVVVGAAHMVGPDGLVTLLRKKGLTVEQK